MTQRQPKEDGEYAQGHGNGGAYRLRLPACDLVGDGDRGDAAGSRRYGAVVPKPDLFDFLLDHPRLPGIVQEDRELEQHGINAVRIVDQKARQFGFSLNEFIDELLHQLRIELHSGRGFAEEHFQLRVVLIAGLPGVGGPIAHERFVRSMDRPRRSLRASQFIIEGVCEVMEVQERPGLRQLGLHQYGAEFR